MKKESKEKKWTDEKKIELAKLWELGYSCKDASEVLGYTKSSVSSMGVEMGIGRFSNEHMGDQRKDGKVRPCLRCSKIMISEGFGNRLCIKCKESINKMG